MSKESINKKKEQIARQNQPTMQPPPASTPPAYVPVYRRKPRGRWNKRFLITFAIWFVALLAAIYFLTRW